MGNYDFNIIVIGAGAGGLVSSYIAAATRAKVALIEKNEMGGDCLNTGCVPSKALIKTAKVLSYAKRSKEFGIETISQSFTFKDVMKRVRSVIQEIAPHDSVERYTQLGVTCINGAAEIITPDTVRVGDKTYRARKLIVSTGARPIIPKIPGLEAAPFLTSDTLWNLEELPKRLVVLGGGPIGCELAQSFARLGSDVTIVEKAERLMTREDPEVSAHITEHFRREGITVLTGHEAVQFSQDGSDNTLIAKEAESEVSIPFDRVLLALGRRANTTGFGLENLGVKIRDNGTIDANPFLQTSVKSIYVCGDVTGPYQFTHVAAHQAWYASVNALFAPFKRFKVDYSIIPWTTFTDPEVARVGLNETEAKRDGIPFEKTVYGIDDLDRAITDGEATGMIKVLTKPGTDKILGVTIVGAHAGDTLAEYVLAMKHGIGLNKILGTIHTYPTFAEANKYVAGEWRRHHAPKWALTLLEKFHTWRRK